MLTRIISFFKESPVFILIFLLGIFLRIVLIDFNPPSLNWDEVSHGYNAYSILKTGKDEWSETLPIIFRAYGDYKLPIYIYTTVVSVAIFGLNTFAVRFPSVIAGSTLIIFTYLIAKELLNKKVALLSAFLVTIEPWSFFLSRGAFEANLALLFFVLGFYFFIKGIEKSNLLLLSFLFFGLSVWTYNSFRIFTPLMLISLLIIFREGILKIFQADRKITLICIFTIAIFFVPMIFQLFNPEGQARYEWVAIIDEGALARIHESRADSQFSPQITRLLFNRPVYFIQHFISNYFSHFTPQFLFIEGSTHYQFSIPGQGILYKLNLPFFYLGLISVLIGFINSFNKESDQNKSRRILFFWIFFAPMASSLTREAPHVLRSVTFLPTPMILSAMGYYKFYDYLYEYKWFKKAGSVILATYILCLMFFLESYANEYFISYRNNYSWAWQYGYEQTVDYAKESYNQYDKIIVTKKYGEPHEFFLFHWPWEPESYQADPDLIRYEQSDWFWVDAYDKFYFVNDWQVNEEGNGNYTFNLESGEIVHCTPRMFDCLLITSPGNVPEGWNKLETISFLDNKPAFEIYEN